MKKAAPETRTKSQLLQHYIVEKNLADMLHNANKNERKILYSSTYDKLFQQVPHHPQLARKENPSIREQHIHSQLNMLRHFLSSDLTFMELGAGDCNLALEVAKHVKKVYAVEISHTITTCLTPPENFELIISDGCSINIHSNRINIIYSNQLMEHLHPDDAFAQIQNIYNLLVPGGVYFCITPNRLNGPHDISKHFDQIATGLHLKEYTNTELINIFMKVGFRKIKVVYMIKGIFIMFSPLLIKGIEAGMSRLPDTLRKKLAFLRPFKLLLGIKIVAIK